MHCLTATMGPKAPGEHISISVEIGTGDLVRKKREYGSLHCDIRREVCPHVRNVDVKRILALNVCVTRH
jgi:hypothetical protein